MSEGKLVFGAVLGVVGGLVILIIGGVLLYAAAVILSIPNVGELPSTVVSVVVYLGIAGVVFGIVIVFLSVFLVTYTEHNVLFGALIIVFSLLSLFIMGGGDGFGALLATVGGACGIAFGETSSSLGNLDFPPPISRPWEAPESHPEAPPLPLGRPVGPSKGCPGCGKACPADSPTCPNCGRAF